MSGSKVVPISGDEVRAEWFRNSYECPCCGTEWEDERSCECNDHCPGCDAEIEPVSSIDLSDPLTDEDYRGASVLIYGDENSSHLVTAEDAEDFAEAMLEGGAHRFEHGRTAAFRRGGSASV